MTVTTPDWVKDAVFYQIFPDRFARSERVPKPNNLQPWGAPPTFKGFQGGDLLGVVEKLDYLTDLGVNAIYFNPIFASAANHRYHTHDYYTVDPILGGDDAFARLMDAAHERDIRIVLDGVFNHCGRGFFQFNHLLECGSESPYVDWFHVHDWPLYAYDSSKKPNYAAWWGLAALPKFNTNTPAVRHFLWDVAEHWLERGIDGWRLDVPDEIDDDAFWEEFRRRCKEVNPDAYLVGELWGTAQRWLAGDKFDAQMNYPFSRIAYGFFGGDNLNQSDLSHTGLGHMDALTGKEFARKLADLHKQYDEEIVQAQLNMLGSHDTPRLMTIANCDTSTVTLMFLCQMTIAGAPNIYYGDEIGMEGGRDPDCRRAFPWEDEASWNGDLLEKVKRYIALRHATPALRRGDFSVLQATEQIVVYRRRYQDEEAVIAFNAGTDSHAFTLQETMLAEPLPDALDDEGEPLRAGTAVTMPPRSGRVWAGEGAR